MNNARDRPSDTAIDRYEPPNTHSYECVRCHRTIADEKLLTQLTLPLLEFLVAAWDRFVCQCGAKYVAVPTCDLMLAPKENGCD